MDMINFQHIPVLLDECIRALALKPEGIYIDGTAGGAGHSREIAGRLTVGRLVAIDRDPEAVAAAKERLAAFPSAAVVRGNFQDMEQIAAAEGIAAADGILLDLGVSSHQLDSGERGFSIMRTRRWICACRGRPQCPGRGQRLGRRPAGPHPFGIRGGAVARASPGIS
jgi:16S rRNA (cytosine1402-N4)-methyltransferase